MNQRILPTCVFLLPYTAHYTNIFVQGGEEPTVLNAPCISQICVETSGGLTRNFHSDFAVKFPAEYSNYTLNSRLNSVGSSVCLVVGYSSGKRFSIAAHQHYSTCPTGL